ncbi:spore-associated protein A [Streptomyces sp. NBC_00158]|uniref:spore-associated protein A n=1 Tax=Streptomyces sp. NBC_00158 TaxID=2903627 RepID=UPI003249F071
MNALRRRAASAAGALALTAAATLAATGTAHAVGPGVCGAGYNVVETLNVGSLGKVYLTWNASTGKNCAVTIRNSTGPAVWMEVWVTRLATGGGDVDNGSYTQYAGPVYIDGRNSCIAFAGTIGSVTVTSEPGHCG